MSDAEMYEANFIFCGKTALADGSLGVIIKIIQPDGLSLSEPRAFKWARRLDKTIGGVYSGAKFNEKQAVGMDRATFVELWHDSAAIQDWRIKSQYAEECQRVKKLEGDKKRINEIDTLLLPLRETYANYARIGDFAGQAALEAAVLRSLRKKP